MVGEHDQDAKTEQPTERRLSEASEQGQFARSHELSVLFPLGAAAGVLLLTAESASRAVGSYSVNAFTGLRMAALTIDTAAAVFGELLLTLGGAIAPLLIAVVGAVLLSCGVQSGFRLSPKATTLKFENLNPVGGFQRVFSRHSLIRGGMDVLKLAAIAAALWYGARGLMHDPLFTTPIEAAYLGQFLTQSAILFLTRLLLALGVVAVLSYAYEKFKTGRQLMMTRQEVKDERKQVEGDPLVKMAMRRMARRLLQRQMMKAIPTADVVVTNPTHFAVALRYERGRDHAPVILAKGENRLARRIKAIAAEHGVPLVENRPVARMLFSIGRVGESIPPGLYQAIAEILAVVYRTHRYYFHCLKARRLEAGAVDA